MVTQPHYILDKYVPEIQRNEPRNVGVILWTRWGVFARFQGEDKGSLDGRKMPTWIESQDSYREWIHAWRRILIRKTFKTPGGAVVTADGPDFLEAIRASGKSNYLLSDGGFVFDAVAKEDCPALLTFLYNSLVDTSIDRQAAKLAFDFEAECNKIIRKTRAFKHSYFKREQPVLCSIGEGVVESFEFDYYYGNGTPQALYQRMPIVHRGFDKSLHATTFQFESVIKAGIVHKDHTAALVMPTEEQKTDEEFKRAVAVLRTQTRVIDLSSEQDRFIEELDELSKELA